MPRKIKQTPIVDPCTLLIASRNGGSRCAEISVHTIGRHPQRDNVLLERVLRPLHLDEQLTKHFPRRQQFPRCDRMLLRTVLEICGLSQQLLGLCRTAFRVRKPRRDAEAFRLDLRRPRIPGRNHPGVHGAQIPQLRPCKFQLSRSRRSQASREAVLSVRDRKTL